MGKSEELFTLEKEVIHALTKTVKKIHKLNLEKTSSFNSSNPSFKSSSEKTDSFNESVEPRLYQPSPCLISSIQHNQLDNQPGPSSISSIQHNQLDNQPGPSSISNLDNPNFSVVVNFETNQPECDRWAQKEQDNSTEKIKTRIDDKWDPQVLSKSKYSSESNLERRTIQHYSSSSSLPPPLTPILPSKPRELTKSNSVTFLLHNSTEVLRPEKCGSVESIFQDINYLKTFKKKISSSSTQEEKTGRYSLLDRNLTALNSSEHVLTDLWKISNKKVNLALAGHMNSCEEEDTEIDCSILPGSSPILSNLSHPSHPAIKRIDYRSELVPGTSRDIQSDNSDSGNDTDDLIEDARNFVKLGQTKLVTLDDWEEIDFKRKERRKTKKERSRVGRDGFKDEEQTAGDIGLKHRTQDNSDSSNPTLPRTLSDLELGSVVKLLSSSGIGVLLGVVRYIGCDEGEDKVGVELKMKRGDSDGTFNNKQYFHCAPGFGVLVPLNQILVAWRP